MASRKKSKRQDPIKTCEMILSYPNLLQPREFEKNEDGTQSKPKYGCVGIISPEQQKTKEYAAMKAMIKEQRDFYFSDGIPRGMNKTFRPCEEMWKENKDTGKLVPEPGYMKGGVFIGLDFGDKEPPDCRDQKMRPITKESVLYPGCKIRAVVTSGGYDVKGNRGVKFYGKALQKIGEGENIAGRVNAEDYFDEVEDDGEDSTEGGTTDDNFEEEDLDNDDF